MLVRKWTAQLTQVCTLALLLGTAGTVAAQCPSWDAHPEGVKIAKEQHVMYRDLVKSKKYEEAFPLWEKLYAQVKLPLPAKSTHFRDGITMYKAFAKAEKDKAKKQEHIDKMVQLYKDMAECLGENASDCGWHGYNLYALRGKPEAAIKQFERSIELGKNETPAMVMYPLTQLTVYLFQKKHSTYTAEYMRQQYETLKGIKEHQVANKLPKAADYEKRWAKVEKEYEKIGGAIWGCDYYVGKLKPDFEADPQNMEQNAEILAVIKKKCGEDNNFYQAVDSIYGPWKDSVDFAEAERKFAGLCNLKKGEFREMGSRRAKKAGDEAEAKRLLDEAFDWYKKSLSDASTEECPNPNEKKADLAYRIAYREYRAGAYSSARSYANKAAGFRSGWGEPYMLIGNMYASSGKRCSGGVGTGWDAQVVAWAAMDMWAKAKSVDPSVAGDANRQIGKYQKYLPTQSDAFQRGYKDGDSYKIGCWIGVSTKVRTSKE